MQTLPTTSREGRARCTALFALVGLVASSFALTSEAIAKGGSKPNQAYPWHRAMIVDTDTGTMSVAKGGSKPNQAFPWHRVSMLDTDVMRSS